MSAKNENTTQKVYPYLILAPCSATTRGRLLSILLHAEIVAVDSINWGVVGLGHMGGGVHLVYW
jgi:hypothetical protein